MSVGKVLILDFGSQYSHIIVRRCRQLGVYSELLPCTISLEEIVAFDARCIILSGGPSSVYAPGAPHLPEGFWNYVKTHKLPLLGICYGMQEMMHSLGGAVEASTNKREFGRAVLIAKKSDPLFHDIPTSPAALAELTRHDLTVNDASEVATVCWMSHGDKVTKLAENFYAVAHSTNSPYAVVGHTELPFWGVQFHPEVDHTECGRAMLKNFLASARDNLLGSWTMSSFATTEVERLRNLIGNKRHVIGALSGGVDSTVAAALMHRAIGDRFHGFMVDTGLLRQDEGRTVLSRLQKIFPDIEVSLIDASEEFFARLKNVTDPEAKRKIIGKLFIDTFVAAVDLLKSKNAPGTFDGAFLLQGTLYPDVIESISFNGPSHTIKTHHNVGGLPDKMSLTIVEPLRELFKDEVRALGTELGLEYQMVWRHPFPGPGLAIRILGSVTRERADVLRKADAIFIEEIRKSGDYDKIGQAFAVLLPDCRSVGVMGDQRTYGMTIVLRAIETSDFMTGDWYAMPLEVLRHTSSRITNEIAEITRVAYDISSKPPATIEWE